MRHKIIHQAKSSNLRTSKEKNRTELAPNINSATANRSRVEDDAQQTSQSLKGNIENFIGYTLVPLGLSSPLLIHGDHAQGEFRIPLATTEGALVASYSRGMKATRLAGGVSAYCVEDLMTRAPYFQFFDMGAARTFVQWAHGQQRILEQAVVRTSNYCRLEKLQLIQEGNAVIMNLSFVTGDASGQNMVTLATDAICKYILNNYSEKPDKWYIESNYSGDKKATGKSLYQTRGKRVIAETTMPRAIVASVLKSTPENICKYFLTSNLASAQAGSLGNTGHVANALTAIFIACGQDVACVAESSIGILRMEVRDNGDLYAALTLPSLVVGTVGGGTHLESQSAALESIDCLGAGKAKKFAELCCATALAGELSIAAAIAEDHFTRAHRILGRR